MAMKLSVIIPTMWRSRKTPALLTEWGKVADEILVIDNAPGERPAGEKIKWLPQSENIGVNPAWNLGVAEARGEIVVLCNDDLLFDVPRWWPAIEQAVTQNSESIVGLHPAGFNRSAEDLGADAGAVSPGNHLGLGWGCLLAMRRADYPTIPEGLRIWWGDNYLAFKLVDQSIILPCHFEASTTVKSPEFATQLGRDAEFAATLGLKSPRATTFMEFSPQPLPSAGMRHLVASAEHTEMIREGFRKAFHVDRPPAEWTWRYERPGTPALQQICLNQDGTLVAHIGWTADRAQIQGLSILAVQGGDMMRLGELTPESVRFVPKMLQALLNHAVAAFEVGWCYGFQTPRLRARNDREFNFEVNTPLPWLNISARRRRWWQRPTAVLRATEHQTELDALWQRAASRYFISVIRDGAWFAQRYDANPSREYVHLGVHRNGRLTAWATLGERLGTTMLVDLLWDGEQEADLQKLLKSARWQAAERGHETLTAWLLGDKKALSILAATGWQESADPQELGVTLRICHPALHRSDFPGRHYVVGGDSDLV